MHGEPITKVFTTRTEEHSVQRELKIPQELINHPRLIEIIQHMESESTMQLDALNLIPESAQLMAQHLLDTSKSLLVVEHKEEPISKLKTLIAESGIVVPHPGERTSKVPAPEGARQLVVCYSKSLNQAHVTSHVQYSKEPQVALRFARTDLSKQRVTYALSQAKDLELEVQPDMIDPQDIKKHKRAKMIQLIEQGWNVLGLLPKD
jgi:hypothetical protein